MIGEGAMAGGCLVPDHEVAVAPPPPHLHVRLVQHRVEVVQQVIVRFGRTDNASGVQGRQVQASATGDRMRPYKRMLDAGMAAPQALGDLGPVMAFDRGEQRRIRCVQHRRPLTALCSTGDNASSTAAVDAHIVSPPNGGMTTALRKPSAGGCWVQLTSVCHGKPAGGRAAVSSMVDTDGDVTAAPLAI